MKFEYALFDLDGTLTDPAVGITNSVMYALRKFGIEPPEREALYKFIGPPLAWSFKEYYNLSDDDSKTAIKYYREYFSDRGIFENEEYDGIDNMLSTLGETGTRIVLATSKPDVYAEKILRHFGLYEYFYFLSGNTLSETRPLKTDVIEYAVKTCGIDRMKAVMTGDREYDILGARACGLMSVGVTYGYGSREELTKAGADALAPDVKSLARLII